MQGIKQYVTKVNVHQNHLGILLKAHPDSAHMGVCAECSSSRLMGDTILTSMSSIKVKRSNSTE